MDWAVVTGNGGVVAAAAAPATVAGAGCSAAILADLSKLLPLPFAELQRCTAEPKI